MAFQLKDFASVTASMINWLKANTTKVTDFNVGSVVRTMLEAAAAEIEELYIQFFVGLKEAIPVSVFNTFGFPALAADSASGIVRFFTPSSPTATITIPAGTIVRVPNGGPSFSTAVDAFILTGQTYVDVLAIAQTPGSASNVDVSTITELVTSISSISSVTNPAPLINGRDAETDDERKVRFQGYISTLARGTKAAIEYGARTARLTNSSGVVTEYVAYAGVVEPWVTDNTQPISLVRCYIHNGAGATSGALVSAAQQVINGRYESDGITPVPGTGWKAAGVQCIVEAAADVTVDVDGTISVESGYSSADVIARSVSAISAYIQGLDVGADVLLSELIAIVQRDVEGVYNIVFADPTADTIVASNAKAIPGTINMTAAA